MKKIIILLCALFMANITYADTETINWYVGNTLYDTTTCQSGGDIILPSAPTKTGYTFAGWTMLQNQVEYLESTGTQYIDTGVNFMRGDEFFFEYMPVASYSIENKGYGAGINLLFNITGGGRCTPASDEYVSMYFNNANHAYVPYLDYVNTIGIRYTEHWSISTPGGNLHSVLTDVQNNLTYELSAGVSQNFQDSGNSIYLWRDHSDSYAYPSRLRIYHAWLKRSDGTLVFDFIPYIDANGVPCMFDNVSGECFYNAGTGNFTVGPGVGE